MESGKMLGIEVVWDGIAGDTVCNMVHTTFEAFGCEVDSGGTWIGPGGPQRDLEAYVPAEVAPKLVTALLALRMPNGGVIPGFEAHSFTPEPDDE
jgi:hypothetical protein